jgi:HD-GYP domain-containing protein (c-di-GMP phosphodiesterase class II)
MQTDFLYIQVDLQTVFPNENMSFDVFNKTLDGKVNVFCAKGNCTSKETLDKIRNSFDPFLYINRNNLPEYICNLQKNVKKVMGDENASLESKVKYAFAVITHTVKNIFEHPIKEDIIKFKNIIGVTLSNLQHEDLAIKELIKLLKSDFTLMNHNINVGFIGIGLAEKIFGALQKETLSEIALGFFLHDIGKLSISRDILLKKSSLSSAEWVMMKKHPEVGCKILYECGILSSDIEKIVLQHHERHDGSGYPAGLKSKDIHIFAKICSIADSYDAMTSKRPYRANCNPFDALKKLKKELFNYYEPEFYSSFINLLRGN